MVVNPNLSGTGTLTLNLYDVAANPSGSISINGSEVTSTITDPGQDAALTFSGTQGQRVNLTLTASTINGYVSVWRQNGSNLTIITSGVGDTTDITLPGTEVYQITINPVGRSEERRVGKECRL